MGRQSRVKRAAAYARAAMAKRRALDAEAEHDHQESSNLPMADEGESPAAGSGMDVDSIAVATPMVNVVLAAPGAQQKPARSRAPETGTSASNRRKIRAGLKEAAANTPPIKQLFALLTQRKAAADAIDAAAAAPGDLAAEAHDDRDEDVEDKQGARVLYVLPKDVASFTHADRTRIADAIAALNQRVEASRAFEGNLHESNRTLAVL